MVAGANTARLEIEHARLADAGVYRVEHLDSAYTETFTLNVFTPPPSRVDRSFSASSVKGRARGFDAAGNILFASDLVPVPGGTNSTWLRPDGTLLLEFVYPLSAGRILAICPDGSLVTARAPYRLGRDGAPLPFALPSSFSGTELSAAAALSDGRFLCAQGQRLTRFLADGTVDPLFTAESVDNVDIHRLTVDVQQRVLVFGSTRGGSTVYRLLESGAVDSTCAIRPQGESVTIFPLRDGRYVLVSSWGVPVNSVELYDSDGKRIDNWRASVSGYSPFLIDPDGNVYLWEQDSSGARTLKRGVVGPGGLSWDIDFYAGRPRAPGYDDGSDLLIQRDGQLLLRGNFEGWDDHPTNSVARLLTSTPSLPRLPSSTCYFPTPRPSGGYVEGIKVEMGSSVTSSSPVSYEWLALDGQPMPSGISGPNLVIPALTLAHRGNYALRVRNAVGSSLSNVIFLDVQKTGAASSSSAPVAQISTDVLVPVAGREARFKSQVSGTGPFTYEWLALDGQVIAGDRSGPELVIPSLTLRDLGRYQVRVTNQGGSTLSNVVELKIPAANAGPYLANLSGRAVSGSGENTVVAGVLAQTSGVARIPALLRAVGPTLRTYGVSTSLLDPAIRLVDANGRIMDANDDWSSASGVDVARQAAGAFPLLAASKDAALLHTFTTGSSTVLVDGAAAEEGVALVEVYQVPATDPSFDSAARFINLSFRARTAPGDATAIVGFVISDPLGFGRSARVLLRAVGPTLKDSGVAGALANPVLTLYDASGAVVARNDDWWKSNSTGDPDALAAAMKKVGAFTLPPNSADSVLLLDLPAGSYSMHATGGSGVVLMEIYTIE